MKVTPELLRRAMKMRQMPKHAVAIADGMNKYGSDLDIRTKAIILANIAVEMGRYQKVEESLYYSATRLREVWPSRFKSNAKARQYAKNPQKLANYVYGGRMGNKGKVGAGWKYRGMGPPQLTGFDNYERFGKASGYDLVNNPEMMLNIDVGMKVCIAFAKAARIPEFAMMGGSGLRLSRKAWNGGYHGYQKFVTHYENLMAAFGAKDIAKPTKKVSLKFDPLLKEYQQKLNEISNATNDPDFSAGLADGKTGPKTKKAVIASQRMNITLWKLAVKEKAEGKLGPKTRKNIDRLHSKFVINKPPEKEFNPHKVESPPSMKVESKPLPPVAPIEEKKPWWKW